MVKKKEGWQFLIDESAHKPSTFCATNNNLAVDSDNRLLLNEWMIDSVQRNFTSCSKHITIQNFNQMGSWMKVGLVKRTYQAEIHIHLTLAWCSWKMKNVFLYVVINWPMTIWRNREIWTEITFLVYLSPFSLAVVTTLVVGVGCVDTIRVDFSSLLIFRNILASSFVWK